MKIAFFLAFLACAGGLPFTCCGPAQRGATVMSPSGVCCPDVAIQIARQQLAADGADGGQFEPLQATLAGGYWTVTGKVAGMRVIIAQANGAVVDFVRSAH